MCGIILTIDCEITKEMMNDLSHRGIRSSLNTYFNNRVQLGHVRLPIQGLSSEYDQPMQYKNLIGAFVGEIFNFKQLDPTAKTDLPVILKLFKEESSSCVVQFDGFWSIIFLDSSRKIHVVTDDLAKKPLYIRRDWNQFGLCSEIKPLKRLGPCTIDELYLAAVAKWGYCTEDRTPYNEIKKLPRSTHFIFDLNCGQQTRFIPLIKRGYKTNLRYNLENAVKNRLVSDVPISLLLSGGVDSTIVFELVKKHTRDFTVFHVENEEEEYLNFLDLKEIPVKKLNLKDISIDDMLYWNETPVDLGSVKPQLALSQAIKEQGVKIAMSGDGADELFGGYRRMIQYDAQLSDIFHELVYYHLPRLDRLMMANTIELRSPYLSRLVINSALDIPYKHRINKRYLKDTFEDLVPKAILDRKKWPLKTKEIRNDKINYRLQLIKKWRKLNECE
jgi:asparagine synthase (glutamine-hydrolysing)